LLCRAPSSPLFPYTTLFRSPLNTSRSLIKRPSASLSVRFQPGRRDKRWFNRAERTTRSPFEFCSGSRVGCNPPHELAVLRERQPDRKSTRLNSSHVAISYAV